MTDDKPRDKQQESVETGRIFAQSLDRAEKRGPQALEEIINAIAEDLSPENLAAILSAVPKEKLAEILNGLPELQSMLGDTSSADDKESTSNEERNAETGTPTPSSAKTQKSKKHKS